jgi:hypothetical protein
MMTRATAWLALLALALSGCAAFELSGADCRSANWYERGERDGFGGHPPQDLRITQQCARHGIVVAQADYLKGWAIGHDEHVRLKSMKCD